MTFTGGTNSLTITSTSIINGTVQAFSTADTFGLGGTTVGTFDLSQLGPAAQYRSFGILQKSDVSVWTLSGTQGNALAYQVTGGTLDLGGVSRTATSFLLTGGTLSNGTLTSSGAFDVRAGTVSAVLNGTGALTKTTSGTVILSGVNTYSGTTTVNAGTLQVDGSITLSALTVNSGATLSGTGSVGSTTIANGGTLAPGVGGIGSLSVNDLTFNAGATYKIDVSPTSADRTNVGGNAILNGATVSATYAPGAYVSNRYTILRTGAGTVVGTFGTLINTNLPANITAALSYGVGFGVQFVYLDLTLNFAQPGAPTAPGFPGGLNGNQQALATTLVNSFNVNGGIPMVFATLTPAGLTQVSGETATGAQQATFDAQTQFLGVMTDPFIAGRGDGLVAPGGGVSQYADEAMAYAGRRKPADALAAIYKKAPTYRPDPFSQRWSVWAAGFGGSQTTDGNATLGSNTATSRIAAVAAGADYRISPYTLAGFALAGGGTNFSVANGGVGRSDLFQAGAFVRHTVGPAYLTAALAYGWQDVTTDRTVTVAGLDRLRANFNANALSGRVEGGYRLASLIPNLGLTPYAAGQATTLYLPAYGEQAIAGANTFALNFASRDVAASRSELGLRSDTSFAMQDGILTLRGRAAWAHNFNPDRSIGATFQTLPGASFVVNGARQASDAALATASAELRWRNNWSFATTFESESSNVTRSYAGKGAVRYAW